MVGDEARSRNLQLGLVNESELGCDCESPRQEWSRREKQACELFSVKHGDFGNVPLPTSFVAKSGHHFLLSFLSGQEAFESLMKAETQKDPWQVMFSSEDSQLEVISKMINSQTL